MAAKPDGTRVKIQAAREFGESSLRDIRKLLGTDPVEAKATITRDMPSIVLKPNVKRTDIWVALLGGAEGAVCSMSEIAVPFEGVLLRRAA
jgi:hypothetical protein